MLYNFWKIFVTNFYAWKHITNKSYPEYRIAPNFHGQIFCDFCELHRNYKNYCHENFLTAPLSTGLDTWKSWNND